MSILPSLIKAAENVNRESSHQRALFCWAHDNIDKYPELRWMFAIPNGGERPKPVAAAMRAEGAKEGVPDIFLPVRRGKWAGLFIELKRTNSAGKKRGYASNEQKEWISYLQNNGYGAAVAVGWEAAKDMLIQYLEYKNEYTT